MLPGLLKFVNMKSRRLSAASGSVWSRVVVARDPLRVLLLKVDGTTIFRRRSSAETSGRRFLLTGGLPRRVRMFTFAHSDYRRNSHSLLVYSYFSRTRLARRILSTRLDHRSRVQFAICEINEIEIQVRNKRTHVTVRADHSGGTGVADAIEGDWRARDYATSTTGRSRRSEEQREQVRQGGPTERRVH